MKVKRSGDDESAAVLFQHIMLIETLSIYIFNFFTPFPQVGHRDKYDYISIWYLENTTLKV